MIKIVIYQESRTGLNFFKHAVGQHTGAVINLLHEGQRIFCLHCYRKLICVDPTIDLKNEDGAKIASKSKITINLSLVPASKEAFESFMKSVDDDISRLESTDLPSTTDASAAVLSLFRTVLQSTMGIMDVFADVRRSPFFPIFHRSD